MIQGNLIKLIGYNFPVAPLVEKVNNSPDLWKENTWRQDYVVQEERPISPQQDTEALMFKWAPENTIESVRDSLKVVPHKNLTEIKELEPLLIGCLSMVGAVECGRVFIAKLRPGGKVIAHHDYGMYSDHFERFHLVLTSSPGNRFFVRNTIGWEESFSMSPGEFFWFNHKETHWAVNESETPRMHLIIDCVAPRFRRERAPV